MEAIYFGNAHWRGNTGAGPGPWVGADLEQGMCVLMAADSAASCSLLLLPAASCYCFLLPAAACFCCCFCCCFLLPLTGAFAGIMVVAR